MNQAVFVIKDTKAGYYHPPSFYRNAAEAVRACTNSVNGQKDSLFAKNAEDFVLFQIGEYSEQTGQIIPCDKKHVADIIDLQTLLEG